MANLILYHSRRPMQLIIFFLLEFPKRNAIWYLSKETPSCLFMSKQQTWGMVLED